MPRAPLSGWIFGTVCPERDTAEALVTTHVSTATMNVFLDLLSKAIPTGTHAIVAMDQASWHVAHSLAVPPNLPLVSLRPCSPELNSIGLLERLGKDQQITEMVLHLPAWS